MVPYYDEGGGTGGGYTPFVARKQVWPVRVSRKVILLFEHARPQRAIVYVRRKVTGNTNSGALVNCRPTE